MNDRHRPIEARVNRVSVNLFYPKRTPTIIFHSNQDPQKSSSSSTRTAHKRSSAKYVYLTQRGSSPLDTMQAWQGYNGRLSFEPISMQHHTAKPSQTRDQLGVDFAQFLAYFRNKRRIMQSLWGLTQQARFNMVEQKHRRILNERQATAPIPLRRDREFLKYTPKKLDERNAKVYKGSSRQNFIKTNDGSPINQDIQQYVVTQKQALTEKDSTAYKQKIRERSKKLADLEYKSRELLRLQAQCNTPVN